MKIKTKAAALAIVLFTALSAQAQGGKDGNLLEKRWTSAAPKLDGALLNPQDGA